MHTSFISDCVADSNKKLLIVLRQTKFVPAQLRVLQQQNKKQGRERKIVDYGASRSVVPKQSPGHFKRV